MSESPLTEQPEQLVVAAVVVDEAGRVLAARRSRPTELAGRWEFPGGKVEAGEQPSDALVRELGEELGVDVIPGAELPGPDGLWPIDERRALQVFFATIEAAEEVVEVVPGDSHDQVRWLEPDALAGLDWLPADVAVAAAVREHLAVAPTRRPRRVVAILNPVAATHAHVVRRVTDRAQQLGWPPITWLPTTEFDFGSSQAEQALALDADLVLVGGGDGTVRAVAERLRGTGVEIGLVPMGTANIFARNLGLSKRRLDQAIEVAMTGTARPLDLGLCRFRTAALPTQFVRDHLFLVLAGLGNDANTVLGTRPWLKRRLGWAAYFESGARHLAAAPVSLQVATDDEPDTSRRLWSLLVGNAGRVPPGVEIFPQAQLDDGWLRTMEVLVSRPWQWGSVAVAGIRGAGTSRRLAHGRARRLRILCSEPVALQLDGDVFGPVLEVEIDVAPRALLVRAPGGPR